MTKVLKTEIKKGNVIKAQARQPSRVAGTPVPDPVYVLPGANLAPGFID